MVRLADRVEPEWLAPSATTTAWVDMAKPTDAELAQLSDVFHFHPLSIEDARSAIQFPKVEQYPGYLYAILHGVDVASSREDLGTRDVDFFVGHSVLVTVHDGTSMPIAELLAACGRYERLLAEGPVALFHRHRRRDGGQLPAVDERAGRAHRQARGGGLFGTRFDGPPGDQAAARSR